jgi:glycosyltransferase involved in cell wall biosynthesis
VKEITVSVIMNCYNSQEYLREAIQSVLDQTWKDWEIVFWDNQSTDNSAKIFKSFKDKRLKYYRAEHHTTLGKARNLAVAQAKGEWLAFLDCDDTWAPEKLEKQLAEITDPDKKVGLVYCPVELRVEAKEYMGKSLANYYRKEKTKPHGAISIYKDLLLNGNLVFFSTLLIQRKLFHDVGGIDDTLKQNEDFELIIKSARISNAVCLDDRLVVFRVHDLNTSHSQIELNFIENIRIFDSLPQDSTVRYAKRLNFTRYGVYKLKNFNFIDGLRLIILKGTIFWILKKVIERVYQFFKGLLKK